MTGSLSQNMMALTPAMKQTLHSAEEVCFAAVTGGQAALFIRTHNSDVEPWRGAGRPVAYEYVAGYYQTGAVISLAVTAFGNNGRTLTAVTLLNISSQHDFPLLLKLTCQDRLYLHLFSNQTHFLFTKWVMHGAQHGQRLTALIRRAELRNACCDNLDWQQATTSFMAAAEDKFKQPFPPPSPKVLFKLTSN